MSAQGSQDHLLDSLRIEKETFWRENNHLLPTEIQRRWSVRTAEFLSVLGATPPHPLGMKVSMSQDSRCGLQPIHGSHSMVRGHSDQPPPKALDRNEYPSQSSAQMSRKRSNGSGNGISPFTKSGRPISPLTITNYQTSDNDPFSTYSLASPAKMQRTSSGRRPLLPLSEVDVYDPEDYIRHEALFDAQYQYRATAIPRNPFPHHSSQYLSTSPSTPSPLSGRFASSLPSTYSIGGQTNASAFTSDMSRQSSHAANSLCGGMDMIKIQSQTSDMSDFSIGEGQTMVKVSSSLGNSKDENPCLLRFDQFHFFGHTGGIIQDTTMPLVPVLPAVTVFPRASPSVVEEDLEMKRDASAESSPSSPNRASRRRQEQLAYSERPIAPKLSDEQIALSRRSSSSEHQMIRIQSADGSSKDVMPIAKQQYSRPHREKIKCDKCNDKPDGFRGEHELRRHTERAHSTLRKVWICVDSSPDKTMLANCKACRQRKPYGAYYNAAAHLRRVHFNPKPKGRKGKGKTEEKRGGKGGGDDPPMEILKKAWMKEIEEYVPNSLDEGADEDDLDESQDGVIGEPLRSITSPVSLQDAVIPAPHSAPASLQTNNDDLSNQHQHAVVAENIDLLSPSFDASMTAESSFNDLIFDFDFSPIDDPLDFGGYDNDFSLVNFT